MGAGASAGLRGGLFHAPGDASGASARTRQRQLRRPALAPTVHPAFTQHTQIINQFSPEPIGSPLVRVLFTKGMIAADFLGDPTGTGLYMPSQTHRASGGLTAGSCVPF